MYVTDADRNVLLTAAGAAGAIPLAQVESPERGARPGDASTRDKWVVSVTTSSSHGWRYVSILPRSFVMAKVYSIERIIWISTALFILAGFVVALYLAYRNSKPVTEIASLARSILGDFGRKEEDLAYIKNSMIKLIASNRQLEDARCKELPLTRATFLERLLRGTIHGEEDLAALIHYNEIELQGDRYVVFIVGIQGFGDILRQDILQELDLNRIVIKDAFSRRFPRNIYAVDLALDRMALICSFDSAHAAITDLEQTVLAVRDELRKAYRVAIVTTEGRICTTLLAINGSFEEAWKTMQNASPAEAEAGVMRYDEQGADRNGFFYPVELESRLILLTRAGHDPEVAQVMRELHENNFQRRCLSPAVLQMLVACLIGTLMRIAMDGEESFSPADASRMQDSAESPEARFTLVRQAFHDVCASVAARRRKTKERLIDRIVAFVRESSTCPELNLSMVASAFGLKESYLYHFFREAVGVTFSSHLESLRIEGACSLLCGSGLAVDEIAARVGYGSAHSFRRAFKRCTALSPSEYQRTHRGFEPIGSSPR